MSSLPDLKLAMTLTARDVEDVIEANLLYHLAQGVDVLIVTEHASVDRTPEILERYAATGKIQLLRESAKEFDHSSVVTRMARMAASEFDADWVIHNDADEFWWPKIGTLKEVFDAVPTPFGSLRAPRFNMRPHPERNGPFHQTMCVADVRSLKEPRPGQPKRIKTVPPKIAHRAQMDVVVGEGNHRARGTGLAPVPDWSPIAIFHYPVRSLAQARRKLTDEFEALGKPPCSEEEIQERWDQTGLTDATLSKGLAAGTLSVDERVARFMRETEGGQPPVPSHPDAAEALRLDALRACWDASKKPKHPGASEVQPAPSFYDRLKPLARRARLSFPGAAGRRQ